MLDELPTQLGIDEIIPGCLVRNVDTFATGVLPRYITVALGGNEWVPVLYRGGLTLTVDVTVVTVLHYRNGDLYEVLGAGGAGGTSVHVPTHGDGGVDPFIHIGGGAPGVTFPGKLWVDTS